MSSRINATVRFALVLAGVLVVAACAVSGTRIFNHTVYRPEPQSHFFTPESIQRGVPVYLAGNPFGIAEDTLRNVVAAGLNAAFPERRIRYLMRDHAGGRTDVFLSLAFDAPKGASAPAMCRAPGRMRAVPSGEHVGIMMTLCWGREPLASIEGLLARGTGVGEGEFVLLIRDMLRRLVSAKVFKSN